MDIIKEPQVFGTPIILYGAAGIGKSTLASLSPKPVFLDIENGLRRLPGVAKTPIMTSWEIFQKNCNDFLKSDYKTMVVDTLDSLEQLLHQYLCKQNQWKSIESPGFGKGYAVAQEHWGRFCDFIDVLIGAGKNVILISHEHIKSFAAPDQDAYDRYNIKINKNSANILIAKVDAVLFAQFETLTKDDKTKEDRVRGMSTGRRVLRCVEAASYVAKNRFGLSQTLEFDATIFDKLMFLK